MSTTATTKPNLANRPQPARRGAGRRLSNRRKSKGNDQVNIDNLHKYMKTLNGGNLNFKILNSTLINVDPESGEKIEQRINLDFQIKYFKDLCGFYIVGNIEKEPLSREVEWSLPKMKNKDNNVLIKLNVMTGKSKEVKKFNETVQKRKLGQILYQNAIIELEVENMIWFLTDAKIYQMLDGTYFAIGSMESIPKPTKNTEKENELAEIVKNLEDDDDVPVLVPEDMKETDEEESSKEKCDSINQEQKSQNLNIDNVNTNTPDHQIESDIQIVMNQTKATRNEAISVLKKNNGDIVNAIMDLS